MADESEERELKTIKFQLMLSPGEAENIDDWMFRRRIRSRAEAIRRLCQIGIAFDENAESLNEGVGKLYDEVDKQDDFVSDLLQGRGDTAINVANIFEARPRVIASIVMLMKRLYSLAEAANSFGVKEKPDAAGVVLKELRATISKVNTEQAAKEKQYDEWRANNLDRLGRK